MIGDSGMVDLFEPPAAELAVETRPAVRRRLPLLPALLVFAAMLPQGLNLRPGGVLLTAPRLVLLAALPAIVWRLLRGQLPAFRFGAADFIVLLAGFWMFLAISMTQGIDRAVVGAGVMVLEFCGSWFLIRTALGRPGEALALARFLAVVIAVDGALSVLDVIAHRPVLHDLADSLTGYDQPWQEDYRHGLMRALGAQEHPIQLGNVCAIGALFAVMLMSGPLRLLVLAGSLTGLVTSNSSAPILGLVLSFAFLIYHKLTASFAGRWWLLFAVWAVLLGALFALHPTPFSFLILHTSAVPQDGFYRLLIWNVVGPLVMAKPLFGLGLESGFAAQFHVNNTIDCFWLASAANFGVVGSALFAATLLFACYRPVRQAGDMGVRDVRLGRALGILVFFFFLVGMTVHFWGTVWLLLTVLAAMRAHLGDLTAAETAREGTGL